MNDPKPPHRVQVEWPPVTVPGQPCLPNSGNGGQSPVRAGDRPADRPAVSGLIPGHLSPTGTGDRPHSDGDGPLPPRGPSNNGDQAAGEGAELLSELRAAIGRYLVLPSDEALTAVTLWVAASHLQPVLQHAPRLAIVGPTKGCGKSRVLDVLAETVHRPMITVNTSPAVVYRIIGKNPPTLLVDEADTIFGPKAGDKEDLRGLLNAGHQRNRPAWRISGPEHKPTQFPTFAMAALAGIGNLPDTIMDRAIVIRMQKRKAGERIAQFRSRSTIPALHRLRDRLAAWLTSQMTTAADLIPEMPVEDRAADTWEPLVLVADLAGGQWPALARAACAAMSRYEADQDEETALKIRLLRDIRRVFAKHGSPDALRTHALIEDLRADAEAPWAEYGTNGLNAYHLGNLLRDFGISSANVRFAEGRQAKGFTRSKFHDAWERYCPETPPPAAETTPPGQRGSFVPPAGPVAAPPAPPGLPNGPQRGR
ncbi:DUF3631 domain-containing protein [Streptomyces sp. B15]|uniref:DUF3631 domain-containing protein n=1 Tax=Streptomyces sp. B15 TaxID=1537797 RepID=UPI0016071054|nr:DUF3631 domain-containing protein [Streptomyces sp. B15]MBQ1120505.1 DUF3631 domain-containing protein [Streptomyces sp. B15]